MCWRGVLFLDAGKTSKFLEFVAFSVVCVLGMNSRVLLTHRIGIAGLLNMSVLLSLG